MKVFAFDPVTGRRGRLLAAHVGRYTYASESLGYAVDSGRIEPIDVKVPNIRGQEWVVHLDAGRMNNSYLTDRWICFCTGHVLCGIYDYWDWVILPPKQLIVRKEAA